MPHTHSQARAARRHPEQQHQSAIHDVTSAEAHKGMANPPEGLNAFDEVRAASMADEGGASAQQVESQEPDAQQPDGKTSSTEKDGSAIPHDNWYRAIRMPHATPRRFSTRFPRYLALGLGLGALAVGIRALRRRSADSNHETH